MRAIQTKGQAVKLQEFRDKRSALREEIQSSLKQKPLGANRGPPTANGFKRIQTQAQCTNGSNGQTNPNKGQKMSQDVKHCQTLSNDLKRSSVQQYQAVFWEEMAPRCTEATPRQLRGNSEATPRQPWPITLQLSKAKDSPCEKCSGASSGNSDCSELGQKGC